MPLKVRDPRESAPKERLANVLRVLVAGVMEQVREAVVLAAPAEVFREVDVPGAVLGDWGSLAGVFDVYLRDGSQIEVHSMGGPVF